MSPQLEKYGRPALKYVAIPAFVLWIIFLIFDMMIMPLATRQGQEFALPDVVGRTENEAQELLKKKELNLLVAGREYSAGKPEGIILSQLPVAGMPVKSGRSVKVVISAGVKITEVPDVSGLPIEQASITLQKAGFVVGDIFPTKVDSLPGNVAIETIPTKGTLLPLGSRVSIAVNQSGESQTVFMPHLVGLPLDRAREILDGLNLPIGDLTKVKDTLYLPNTVLEQIPVANTRLSRGDQVRLTISKTD